MYLLYTIVTISYPSKLHGRGGTVTVPVLIGSRGSGFGSKINEVSVQRERGSERLFLTLELLLMPYIREIWGSGEKKIWEGKS